MLQNIQDILRRPGGIIPYPIYVPPVLMPVPAPIFPTVPTPPFIFGAKSQKRLQVACDLIRFYETVGRLITASNVQWNPQMKNFAEQWKALTMRKDKSAPKIPKISKALPVIKRVKTFRNHLNRYLGVRKIHIAYLTFPYVGVTGVVPPQDSGQPYSADNGFAIRGFDLPRLTHPQTVLQRQPDSIPQYGRGKNWDTICRLNQAFPDTK